MTPSPTLKESQRSFTQSLKRMRVTEEFSVGISDQASVAPQWQSPNQYGKEAKSDYAIGGLKASGIPLNGLSLLLVSPKATKSSSMCST